jgi:N-acetylmuramoyl-L-alanine amidase
MGSLDAPANGTTVTGRVPVGGWALSEDTVESVGVYLDRRYLLDAQLGNVRPDVQKAYPRFREAGTAGWTAVLDLTNVAAGPHTIQAQIRSKTGGMTTFEHGVTVR